MNTTKTQREVQMQKVFNTINDNPKSCAALSPSKLASAISNIKDAKMGFYPLAALEAEFDFRTSLNLTKTISADDVETSKSLFNELKASNQYNEAYDEYMKWRLEFWNNADGFIVLASEAEEEGMLIPFKITEKDLGNMDDYLGASLKELRKCMKKINGKDDLFGLYIDRDLLPPKFAGGGSFALPVLIALHSNALKVFQEIGSDDRQIKVGRPMFVATGGLCYNPQLKAVCFDAVGLIEKKKKIADAIGAFFVCVDNIDKIHAIDRIYDTKCLSIPNNIRCSDYYNHIVNTLIANQYSQMENSSSNNEKIESYSFASLQIDSFSSLQIEKHKDIFELFIDYLINKKDIKSKVILFAKKLFDEGFYNLNGEDVFEEYSYFLEDFFANLIQTNECSLEDIIGFSRVYMKIEIKPCTNIEEVLAEFIQKYSKNLESILRHFQKKQMAHEKVNRISKHQANVFQRFILFLTHCVNIQDDPDVLLWKGILDIIPKTIETAMNNGADAKVTVAEIIHKYSKYLKDFFRSDVLSATPTQYILYTSGFNEKEIDLFKKDSFPSFISFLLDEKTTPEEDVELSLWHAVFNDDDSIIINTAKNLKKNGHEIDFFDTKIILKYSHYLEEFFQKFIYSNY